MRCRHYFSFALVAFLSLFFGFFIITNNCFATDYNFDIVNGTSTSLCTGSHLSTTPDGVPFCDDIHSITFSSSSSFSGSIRPYFSLDNSSGSCSSQGSTVLYFPFNFSSSFTLNNLSHVCGIFFGNSYSLYDGSSFSWTVTLSTDDSSSPSCPPSPSGELEITENGTYDVSSYATATVDVPAEVIQGDYHNDLVNIQNAIITCGAILLVLYFFYCIYRLIIKNSGVH